MNLMICDDKKSPPVGEIFYDIVGSEEKSCIENNTVFTDNFVADKCILLKRKLASYKQLIEALRTYRSPVNIVQWNITLVLRNTDSFKVISPEPSAACGTLTATVQLANDSSVVCCVMIIITLSIIGILFTWSSFFGRKEWSYSFSKKIKSILVFISEDTFVPVWTDTIASWVKFFSSLT